MRVSIPDGWDRRSTGDCVYVAEHWGPPTQAGCGHCHGVHFVDLDTFDAVSEPGVVPPGPAPPHRRAASSAAARP